MKIFIKMLGLMFFFIACATQAQTDMTIFEKNVETTMADTTKTPIPTTELSYSSGIVSSSQVGSDANEYYVKFNSLLPTRLGYGINISNLKKSYNCPIDYDVDSVDGSGSLTTTFQASLITNYSELKKYLQIDANLEVGLFGLGDASMTSKFTSDFSTSSNSIYFVIRANTEYGRIGLKNIRLTRDASKLIKNKNGEFTKRYGYGLPIMEDHGANLYIIYRINSSSEMLKEEFNINAQGSMDIGIFSSSMDVSLKTKVEKILKSSDKNVYAYAEGTEAFNGMSGLLQALNAGDGITIDKIVTAASNYLNSFNFKNSIPLGFNIIKYEQLGIRNTTSNSVLLAKNVLLQRLIHIYIENNKNISILENLKMNDYYSQTNSTGITTAIGKLPRIKQFQQYLFSCISLIQTEEIIEVKVKIINEFDPDDTSYFLKKTHYTIANDTTTKTKIVINGNNIEGISMQLLFNGMDDKLEIPIVLVTDDIVTTNTLGLEPLGAFNSDGAVTIEAGKATTSLVLLLTKYLDNYLLSDTRASIELKGPVTGYPKKYSGYMYLTVTNILGISQQIFVGRFYYQKQVGETPTFNKEVILPVIFH